MSGMIDVPQEGPVALESEARPRTIWDGFEDQFRKWSWDNDSDFSVVVALVEVASEFIPNQEVREQIVRTFLNAIVIEGGPDSWGSMSNDQFAGILNDLGGNEIAKRMYEESPRDSRARVILSTLGAHVVGGW